ncbi:bacterioferritin [Alkalicella caledoniensis]|uniref:Bacterioferritin n=1 Tax=Alkalicella caledoniensis TaxID=2731377 RepID=A0A7G9W9R8_ALKCA|nr:ferritin-like domain-containing protein [Alkalicella caledoniensis]QNO15430.1 bacterioferritin [Alkalicella caledoniensis]
MITKHPKNIHLLLDDYAGPDSELTAILQYFHHYFVVKHKDVAQMLEKFSLNEMQHFEMLGHILEQYGIDPRVYDSNRRYWSGADVNYQYKVCDILQVNLQGELGAISNYYQRINQIPVPEVQEILLQIINDEIGHVQGLTKMIGKYCPHFRTHDWLKEEFKKFSFTQEIQDKLLTQLK